MSRLSSGLTAVLVVLAGIAFFAQTVGDDGTGSEPLAMGPIGKILVDAMGDGGVWWSPQGGSYNPYLPHQGRDLADCFRTAGYEVTELPGMGGPTITPDMLSEYDMVFAANRRSPLTDSEAAAYRSFASGGKGLFIAMEFTGTSALSQAFGLTFAEAYGSKITRFVDHPLTKGVTTMPYGVGSRVTVPYPNGSQILGSLETMEPVLGTFPFGSGNVVFLGDTNTPETVPQPFTDNYLGFLLGPGARCGKGNAPPVADAGGPYLGYEGFPLTLTATATDPDNDTLTYRWDFDNDGTADTSWSSSPALTHTWPDDYTGLVRVEVSDGKTAANATATVTILNLPPTIDMIQVPAITATATLRIAGEKWHDVSAYMVDGDSEALVAKLTRQPGKPQETSFPITIDPTKGKFIRVVYTPQDDKVNGQPSGATPAWLTFTFDGGGEETLHHTFNVRHPGTYNWTVSLNSLLAGREVRFTATATDPGSDDLTFTWDWGDGSPATATTYYNDGIGPDPYPSPGGNFPFTATDEETHVYSMAGTYNLEVTVRDDDGGTCEMTILILI